MFPAYKDRNVSYAAISKPWKAVTEQTWGTPVDDIDEVFQRVVQMNDPVEAGKLLRKAGFERGYDRVVADVAQGIKTGVKSNVRGAV